MNVTALASLCASVFFFVCFLLFSCFNYKAKFRSNYDIRNHFPYELNYELRFADNLFGNIALVLSLIGSVFFFIFFSPDKSNGLLIFTLISGVIVAFDVGLIIFVPIKYLRAHMALDVFLFTFGFLIPCAGGVAGLLAYNSDAKLPHLVMAILLLIDAFIQFIVIMNPKLTRMNKMSQVTSDDGTITYIRPKYYVLAFSEWLLIFIYFISQILLMILLSF